MADRLLEGAEAELGEQLPHLLGDVQHEVLDELRLAREALAQHRVLRRDADRAGVQVADPHHDAARHDQRGGGEAELLGAEQGADDDVAAGLELPVDLHDDAVTQAVEHQGLLGLGQAELPRCSGVLERRQRAGAGAAVVAGDQHDVGLGLGHAGGHRPDADLGDQLHVDAGVAVRVLEVVDQLRQVLDRVDVVVRWRRDQPDAGRGVPGRGDPRVHLVAGELTALARLGSLGHLDLDVVRVGQVLGGDAEATRGHLLDRRAAQVAVVVGGEAVRVLPTLTRVGLAAEAVHRDGERLVGLGGDRAVAHRTGREPLDDLGRGFDLVEGNRGADPGAQAEQPAERGEVLGLVVDQLRVLLEHLVLAAAGRVLQLVDGLRVEQVVLAFAAPLVLAAGLEGAVRPLLLTERVGAGVATADLFGHLVQADAAQAADRAGEVLVDQIGTEADRLEDLGAGVGRHGRDAHLGHHLEDPLADRLAVVGDRGVEVGDRRGALGDHVLDRVEGQIGVDRRGAEAEQEGEVVHLAGLAGLDHQADLGAGLLADQVVVHRGCGQQHGDRGQVLVGEPVRQDDDVGALGDRFGHLGADPLEGPGQTPAAGERGEQAPHGPRLEVRVGLLDVLDPVQVLVGEDRVRHLEQVAGLGSRIEQVALGADDLAERGDQLLADGVERRVRHLGEQLLEVVVDQPWALGEDRQRRVGAHRADRLSAGADHRLDQDLEVLLGVAEGLLLAQHVAAGLADVGDLGQVLEPAQLVRHPLAVGVRRGQLGLDLRVVDDPALGGVDQEHPPGLEPALAHDAADVDRQRADLGGHDHQAVVADPVARRAQAVAVEHGADNGSVGEGDRGGAVPGLHDAGVEPVEVPDRRVHVGVPFPRLGDHHQHGVRQRVPAQVQQLEHLVESGGVGAPGGADREDPLQVLAAGQVR